MNEVIALALISRLYRTGLIDAKDVEAVAKSLEADDPAAAMQVRHELLTVMADGFSLADEQAKLRRQNIRLVDGGNDDAD